MKTVSKSEEGKLTRENEGFYVFRTCLGSTLQESFHQAGPLPSTVPPPLTERPSTSSNSIQNLRSVPFQSDIFSEARMVPLICQRMMS